MPPVHGVAEPARRSVRQRGRPPGSEPIVTREQVIAAAVRAVRVIGPAITMDDIAAQAGVTKPIVYRTVGDKAAIGAAVAEYLSLRVETMTVELLDSEAEPREQFKITARAFFELLADDRSLFLFVEHGWSAPAGDQIELMIERAAEPFIGNYAASAPARLRPAAAARTWAYATVGVLRTVAVMWVRDPYCELDEVAELVTDYVHRPFT